jgi:hypothetical protein
MLALIAIKPFIKNYLSFKQKLDFVRAKKILSQKILSKAGPWFGST